MKKFTLLLSLLFAIISLQAQDYLISFAGTGASTTVGSVTVENLTQGTSISLLGSDVLHLSGIWNGINTISDSENALRIYPNPTTDNSIINFVATASGTTNVELFDIAGRRVVAAQNLLSIGSHSYQVSGLRSGIYTVRINTQANTYTGKLLSNGAPGSDVRINYLGNGAIPAFAKMLKSASTETTMQYTTGDILKFTSISGNYKTISTDVPTQSKTITFPFVACTDSDGNNYPVVQIGTQIWMGENLKTTKYRNGDPIPNVTDNTLWSNLRTGAYCDYDNRTEYSAIYGKLYNWHAVNDSRNIAPTGWHVPTNVEWSTWTTFLGDENIGGKLKETGTIHWVSPNTGATNEAGFTALPGGARYNNDGAFHEIGDYGNWWTSSEYSIPNAYYQYMSAKSSSIKRDYELKENGFSVRCVSDISLPAGLPILTTKAAIGITSTTATSGGQVTSDGGATITARGVCWSTNQTPTTADGKTTDGSEVGSFTSQITGLSPNTTYYQRSYATNSVGTGYGSTVSFRTASETVTDIDGNVYSTTTIGTQVWTVENLKTTKYNDGTNIPNVTDNSAWSNLTAPGYCWYNNDIANKTPYGALYNWHTVNTGKLAPIGWHVPTDAEWTTLTTFLGGESVAGGKLKETGTSHWLSINTGATNETGFTALPGSLRNDDGTFGSIGGSGVWWSSTESGTSNAWLRYLYYSDYNLGRDNGSKSCGFSVRCVRDFYTINTTAASSITTISAICGGNITNDYGIPINERGVCYSTNQNPTTNNSKVVMGSGSGIFSNTLSGLSPNTTYYVRAYAMNSEGTAYGNEISFKTYTGTVTDIEGNVYNTVTIGTQVWTVENLQVTKYNDGTSIPNVTGNTAWANLAIPGYCWYNNDITNKSSYGALYNWYTVNTGKLAPTGWHVPTDADWTTLTNFLGGETGAGGKLKEAGTTHWVGPNTGATNETSFTALPAGHRNYDGTFDGIGYVGNWWSSTGFGTSSAWTRFMYCNDSDVNRTNDRKEYGFSVRCVRDF